MNASKLANTLVVLLLAIDTIAFAEDEKPLLVEHMSIEGVKDPEKLDAKKLRQAIAALKKNQSLAPDAPLRFFLKQKPADVGISAKLLDGEVENSLVLKDGVLTLADYIEKISDSAEIILNQKTGSVTWRAYIRSPSSSEKSIRLGDYRLECHVMWALEKDTLSLPLRAPFAALGGPCGWSKVGVFFTVFGGTPKSALIRHAGRTEPVFVREGKTIRPPIYD
ncbi:MAG: hypothetical protein ACRCWJ_14670, partial [Casimicrobium sp.]